MDIPDFTDFIYIYELLAKINAKVHDAESAGVSKQQYYGGSWVNDLSELYKQAAETVDDRPWFHGFSLSLSPHFPPYVELSFHYNNPGA